MELLVTILIAIVALAIALAVSYWIIRAAVGAAIRQHGWVFRGEAPPDYISPGTGKAYIVDPITGRPGRARE